MKHDSSGEKPLGEEGARKVGLEQGGRNDLTERFNHLLELEGTVGKVETGEGTTPSRVSLIFHTRYLSQNSNVPSEGKLGIAWEASVSLLHV